MSPLTTPRAYTSVIHAMALARQWQRAVELYASMEGNITVRTVNAVLHACAVTREWPMALRILEGATAQNNVDAISYNTTLSALAKAGQWRIAVNVLHAMPTGSADTVSYSTVISSCTKAGTWRTALSLLHAMELGTIVPNTITYNAAISACGKALQWPLSLDLLAHMRTRLCAPTLITYNSILSAMEKGRQWERAYALLDKMMTRSGKNVDASSSTRGAVAHQIRPDAISFNACISALEKGRQWELALAVFDSMRRNNTAPTHITYNAVLSALEKGKQWEKSLELFYGSAKEDGKRDVVAHNAVLSALEKGQTIAGNSCWRHAVHLLVEMMSSTSHVVPDVISFNAVLGTCAKAGEWCVALDLLEKMNERIEEGPGAIAYSLVLRACARPTCVASSTVVKEKASRSALHWALETDRRRQISDDGRGRHVARLEYVPYNALFIKGPSEAMELLIALGVAAPKMFVDEVRQWVFDRTVQAILALDVEALQRFGLPNLGPFTRDALLALGLPEFDATEARRKVASTGLVARLGDVRAREVLVHVKSEHVDQVGWYGLRTRSDALPSVYVHHDRSAHAERQALLRIAHQHECTVELYVTHRPCVSCLTAMVAFRSPTRKLKIVFDDLHGGRDEDCATS
eukprot:GEMP01018010.1.p1 GENE.GEMP01018010.1~~GEMP01018010.1.p1  ORF type:complete len:635 (+),score=133.95 GEMP01018010.1:206-2110(+)